MLTETEKELGVAVADIGAGTIDLALFADGSPFHTSVLPVGGNNVTNDVAIGVKTTLQVAEELKVRHGTCDLRDLEDEEIAVSVMGEDAGRTVSREELCQIIEARMRETFELLRGEMARSGHGMLPAGIILTGGAAQLAGTAELGREVLQMPVRVGAPDRDRRPRRHDPGPVVLDRGRAAPLGRDPGRAGRAAALRVGARRRRLRPHPGRDPLDLPLGARPVRSPDRGPGRGRGRACGARKAGGAERGGLLRATAGIRRRRTGRVAAPLSANGRRANRRRSRLRSRSTAREPGGCRTLGSGGGGRAAAGRGASRDLTPACARFAAEAAEGGDGLLSVFVPHATAGVVILELGAGSDADALHTLDRLLPRDDRWTHRHGSPGHGADHVLPLLAAPSITVPVLAGRLALGTWQSIALLDPNADNATRHVRLSFLAG